jgi:hypothetical protein
MDNKENLVTHTWAKPQDANIKYIIVKKLVSLIFIVSIMWNWHGPNSKVQNPIFWVGYYKVRFNLESNKNGNVICVAPPNSAVILMCIDHPGLPISSAYNSW